MNPIMTSSSTVKSVLILRPDGIGDAVLFSGALAHLRRRWPVARIEMVTSSVTHELFALCPHLDRLWTWEAFRRGRLDWLVHARGNVRFGSLYRTLRDLAARVEGPFGRRYDLLLNPVRAVTPKIHDLVRRVRAAEKFGIAGDTLNQSAENDDAASALYTRRMRVEPDDLYVHELEISVQFLDWLNCPVDGVEDIHPTFWLGREATAVAERRVPRPSGARVLGLVPGSGLPRKCWPADRFVQVARNLDAFSDVVILGGPNERPVGKRLASLLVQDAPDMRVIDLTGRLSLRELVAVVARCDLVVGNDTGAMHMAVAQHRPTVVVMGGLPHKARFYPWSDPARHRAIYREGDAFERIAPDDVLDCVHDVLATQCRRGARTAVAV